jgi:hypothetical protein
MQGDFHNIPAESNTFDAAYQFEATCHASDLTRVRYELWWSCSRGSDASGRRSGVWRDLPHAETGLLVRQL